jgi:CRP/FNR family cyclic AMP-dependent transcriptional regulator
MSAPDLSGVELLRMMTATQREALAKFGVLVEFPPGEEIVRQGQLTDALFLVLHGKVGVFATDDHGGQGHLRTIESGGHFGEVGWLRAAKRTATVRAVLRSRLFKLDGDALEELLKAPDVATPLLHALCQSLASRLADTTTRVADLLSVKDFWTV